MASRSVRAVTLSLAAAMLALMLALSGCSSAPSALGDVSGTTTAQSDTAPPVIAEPIVTDNFDALGIADDTEPQPAAEQHVAYKCAPDMATSYLVPGNFGQYSADAVPIFAYAEYGIANMLETQTRFVVDFSVGSNRAPVRSLIVKSSPYAPDHEGLPGVLDPQDDKLVLVTDDMWSAGSVELHPRTFTPNYITAVVACIDTTLVPH